MEQHRSRRALLKVAGGGLIGVALGAIQAQTAVRRLCRVGFLSPINSGQDTELVGRGHNPQGDSPRSLALRQALRDLGYVEGENLNWEYRAALSPGRQVEFATELARLPVDVIVAGGAAATAAVQASKTSPIVRKTPIVILVGGDPVAAGLVTNLEHPGGNVTGLHGSLTDSVAKGLGLLKQAVPGISHVAALCYRVGPLSVQALFEAMAGTAKKLGIRLDRMEAHTPDALTSTLDSIIQSGANGLVYVQAGAQFGVDPNAARVVNWANTHKLPAAYCYQEYIDAGGLLGYTWDNADQWRRAAGYIDKILRGAYPGDLPVEGARKFDFLINLRTARALGLTIPRSVIDQATLIQ